MNAKYLLAFMYLIAFSLLACSQNEKKEMIDKNKEKKTTEKYNDLSPEEERVLLYKGTEAPFSGKFYQHKEEGTYVCKRCNAPLYRSEDKFDAHCGWPSFDDEIEGAVERVPDADGRRTEIICANCKAHLGHVFIGEELTDKNTRHCVNSISMEFIPGNEEDAVKTDTAIFASGCFWGTEYYMQKAPGVISVESGYTGGTKENPTYQEVSTGNTEHAEAVLVTFDPGKTTYEALAKLFFETHNPGQENGQGPDIGSQYRSAIFYKDEAQKQTAKKLINILREKGHKVVTELNQAGEFYKAEDYHQDYYQKSAGTPYCHKYEKKF